jgi:hypothetical protein
MLTMASHRDLSGCVYLEGGRVARTGSSSASACSVGAARDEEVGSDARVGRVMPVERGHTQVKPHLLPQEGDLSGHESDREWCPCDCAVDAGDADRAPALAVGEHRRGLSGAASCAPRAHSRSPSAGQAAV